MILSDKKGIQQIVITLAQLGLQEVILCPGSRDAPLMISFNRHPDFHCTGIRDERSAGFFALGKALEKKEPVAVVCTSGSAALNFAPAISEAYYQRIPLIVLTADRPKEWTDQGDGQTINQTGLYKNYIRKSFDLKGDLRNKSEAWFNERALKEGMSIASILDPGPVHFNIPLTEPLYNTESVNESRERKFSIAKKKDTLSDEEIKYFSNLFSQRKKVMVVVGQHPKDEALQEVLVQFSRFDNVIVLTESTSNIHHPNFIENIDRLITNIDDKTAKSLMPDFLLTIGAAIVSKRIKKILRKFAAGEHWNIRPFEATMDTYQSLTKAVFLEPVSFFRQVLEEAPSIPSNYKKKWLGRKKLLAERHTLFTEKSPYSDFKVFHSIIKNIPDRYSVHWANSSAIRYAQLFDNKNVQEACCNRGTSGIDGCTSTAMGAASAAPQKDFLLVTGDMAFHYDVNALWNEEQIENLRIIIVNNGGGGIFRIISGPNKVKEIEPFFEARMTSNVKDIANHYQWNYLSAIDEKSLQETLTLFFKRGYSKTILEIFTDNKENPKVLEEYWHFLKGHSTEN